MKRILLLPIGSSGDVNPFLWIGRQLRDLGHEVSMVANPLFATAVSAAGLRFVPIGTEEEYHSLTEDPVIWHPREGTPVVLRFAGEATNRYFEVIQREAAKPGPLLLVAPATAFGARLAREKLGLPLVTVNLQPSVYRSVHETALFGRGLAFIARLPKWAKRAFFDFIDFRINRELAPGIFRACREQSVPPPRNPFRDWWQSPDGAICLFPEWFARPQPDWTPQPHCIGFPLEDLAREHAGNSDLEAFLADGEPPILFTPGTAMAHGRHFFAPALAACVDTRRRGLFVTRFPSELPADLPASIRHFDYLPFSTVLPRCAAIVHHGGIGTTSQALAAGLPQIIMPLAHDQPDNAARVQRLGAGVSLWPNQFTPANLIREIQSLLTSGETRKRCAQLTKRIQLEDPSAALRDALAFHLSDA